MGVGYGSGVESWIWEFVTSSQRALTGFLGHIVSVFLFAAGRVLLWRPTYESAAAPKFHRPWHVYKNIHIPDFFAKGFLCCLCYRSTNIFLLIGRPESSANETSCAPFLSASRFGRPFLHAPVFETQNGLSRDQSCSQLAAACIFSP